MGSNSFHQQSRSHYELEFHHRFPLLSRLTNLISETWPSLMGLLHPGKILALGFFAACALSSFSSGFHTFPPLAVIYGFARW